MVVSYLSSNGSPKTTPPGESLSFQMYLPLNLESCAERQSEYFMLAKMIMKMMEIIVILYARASWTCPLRKRIPMPLLIFDWWWWVDDVLIGANKTVNSKIIYFHVWCAHMNQDNRMRAEIHCQWRDTGCQYIVLAANVSFIEFSFAYQSDGSTKDVVVGTFFLSLVFGMPGEHGCKLKFSNRTAQMRSKNAACCLCRLSELLSNQIASIPNKYDVTRWGSRKSKILKEQDARQRKSREMWNFEEKKIEKEETIAYSDEKYERKLPTSRR